ncbi:MAG: hypothetical protein SFV15_04370 [Polyangiaceae bacterium]|nr:hypothetical protein [Polyangiaceae bacterium]
MFRTKLAAFTLFVALCLPGLALLGGCATRNIPDTDVADSEFNRRVLDFCETYRKAVERRSIGQLASLAAPTYYEDGGNADSSDDMGLEEFKASLKDVFAKARAIRYEIRYRRIGRGEKNEVYVDYTYSASYKVPTENGDVWRRRVAENRLELIENGETFRIVAGM